MKREIFFFFKKTERILCFLLFYLKVGCACADVVQPLRVLLFVIFHLLLYDILSRPVESNTSLARLRMSGAIPPLVLYAPIECRDSRVGVLVNVWVF